MNSSCVLLDRLVYFVDDPALSAFIRLGEVSEEEEFSEVSEEDEFDDGTWGWPSLEGAPSWETITKSINAHLEAMKPALRLSAPPQVSDMSLVRPSVASGDCNLQFGRDLDWGFIAAVDNNMVVLHVSSFCPGHSTMGRYLVYNARSSILSVVPCIPPSVSYYSIGFGTVIAAAQDPASTSTFILAEMFRSLSMPSKGVLFVWSQEKQVWIEKVGCLPAEVCQTMNTFCAHMSFSKGKFFWVDLLHGLLIYDLEQSPADGSHAEFSFIRLPQVIDNPYDSPREFRTVASVDGIIKFVNVDGYLNGKELGVITWTLSIDGFSPSWTIETTFWLRDLWEDATFISMGLPKGTPMYPMLNIQEHDIAYVVLTDPTTPAGHAWERVQYMVEIDTRWKKALSSTKSTLSEGFWREFAASNFHLFLPGSKDHTVICPGIVPSSFA